MKRAPLNLGLMLCLVMALGGSLHAQCYGSLALSPGFFEFDHLVRLCVHFGDLSDIPADIICSESMPPGQNTFDVPIYAYNVHEGIQYLEFSVASNESIAVFVPDNCFSIVSTCRCRCSNTFRLDLALQACGPTCGPVRVGAARVVRVASRNPVWVDLRPNGQTGKMFALDIYGDIHNAFSPQHGGFIGFNYLYACQQPICEEPNLPVTSFKAENGPSCSVKLTWIAGGGNRTMIRFRSDRYPAGYEDGQLVVEVPSTPGQSQYFYHTGFPNPATLYYKAFSLTRDNSDLIVRDSFVECASLDTVQVHCQIAVESASWGSIKSLFK